MPLLDHFRPPLYPVHHWESFHSNWATRIADALNQRLPPDFLAEEYTHAGSRVEIDVAAFERPTALPPSANGPAAAVAEPLAWAPPAPAATLPAAFPDSYEVRVFRTSGGLTLVGVIELVSPSNKDRPDERRAFALKSAGSLAQGLSLIVVDVVTTRRANLHDEIVELFAPGTAQMTAENTSIYAVAYRPVRREGRDEIDVWTAPLALGRPLPTLPLRLTGETFVPIDLEATYDESCRRKRLT